MPLSSTGRIDATKLKWILLLGVVIAISASIQIVLIVLQPENPRLERDEYLTLDRSRSIVERGLWLKPETNYDPLFLKPPLQYWLTALLVKCGIPYILSMQLVSVFFFAGLLLFMMLLGESLRAEDLNLKLLILLLAISSPTLVSLAGTGLLDIGHAFFLMVTVSSVYLSQRNTKWWYAVCLGWSLGLLQKSPIALCITVFLTAGLSLIPGPGRLRPSDLLRDRHFQRSWAIGILICSVYWIIQYNQFGLEFFKVAYIDQMVSRFIPAMPNDPERFRGWGFIFYHLIRDGVFYWILSFLILITFIFKYPHRLFGREWLLVCYVGLVFTGFVFSGGVIYFRYMTILIPFIAVLVSLSMIEIFRSFKWLQWSLAGIMFASSLPVYQREWNEIKASTSPFLSYVEHFKSYYEPDLQPVIIYSNQPFNNRVFFEAIVYHLNAPWKVLSISCGENCGQRIRNLKAGQPYFFMSETAIMNDLDSFIYWDVLYFVDENYSIGKGRVKNEL